MKTVHIVYGPPLAGKSTFVRENMGPGDLVSTWTQYKTRFAMAQIMRASRTHWAPQSHCATLLSHTSITRGKTPAATHGSLYQAQARNISPAAFSVQELR